MTFITYTVFLYICYIGSYNIDKNLNLSTVIGIKFISFIILINMTMENKRLKPLQE